MSGAARKVRKRTFSLPKGAERIATIKVPEPQELIYFLTRNSQCVYVGQSCAVFGRLGEHVASKQFDEVWALPVLPHEDMRIQEARWINWYRPEYSKVVPFYSPSDLFRQRGQHDEPL